MKRSSGLFSGLDGDEMARMLMEARTTMEEDESA
jgi:hypothetical protein